MAIFVLAAQGLANGREPAGKPRVEGHEGRLRRLFDAIENGGLRTRRLSLGLSRAPSSDPEVHRTQAESATPAPASADEASVETEGVVAAPTAESDSPGEQGANDTTAPADLSEPAADRGVGMGAPPTLNRAGGAPTGPIDLNLPAANRRISVGGPAQATSTSAPAPEDRIRHLQDLLGYEDSPVRIYGWIQNSYTGNANGTPRNGLNFGVNPNRLANAWQGNQYYLVVENPLEQNDRINFGFRADFLFGNDWQFSFMQGMLNNAFKLNSFAGVDFPQIYGEVHLPYLVKGGIDVKAGRGYSIAGYEQLPAIARPFLSVPYMFNYGQPFTQVGVLTIMHPSDRVNLYNGVVNGWDRWINNRYLWGYVGGVSWTSKDDRTTLASTVNWGPNQFPSQLPANQQLYDDGYVNVPSIAGLPNPGYFRNDRTLFTTVLTHKWSDKLTQVVESDQGWERSIPGLGSGGRNGKPRSATWFSFGNWFLVDLSPKLTGVWRSEVFWDPQGARVQNMSAGGFVGDRYYEMTLGLIYKPTPNIWFRPEVREDWTQYHKAFSDDTRKSQLTLAFDVILLW